MQETSGSRRRVPPRGNPDEPAQPQMTFGQQVSEVPWGVVILTTAVTTLAGYLTIEGIRALHAAVRRRRERELEDDNPPVARAQPQAFYGARPDGSFLLPGPEDMDHVVSPITTGFGQPLRYAHAPANPQPQPTSHGHAHSHAGGREMSMDERLARIESVLLAQQQRAAARPEVH